MGLIASLATKLPCQQPEMGSIVNDIGNNEDFNGSVTPHSFTTTTNTNATSDKNHMNTTDPYFKTIVLVNFFEWVLKDGVSSELLWEFIDLDQMKDWLNELYKAIQSKNAVVILYVPKACRVFIFGTVGLNKSGPGLDYIVKILNREYWNPFEYL